MRALRAPVALDADDQALLAPTIEYPPALEIPEVLAYLKSRRAGGHPELVDAFGSAWPPARWPARTRENSTAGAAIHVRLKTIGMLRESVRVHFNGSLVVLVFDADGSVAEVYGRDAKLPRDGTRNLACW